jgi:hypothetical protein
MNAIIKKISNLNIMGNFLNHPVDSIVFGVKYFFKHIVEILTAIGALIVLAASAG